MGFLVTGQGGIKHEHRTEMGVVMSNGLALRQEILKSHIVAERARDRKPSDQQCHQVAEEDLERLEKNVLGTSSDLDQDKFEY